jgi:predicted MFS family arabinose efflux permease
VLLLVLVAGMVAVVGWPLLTLLPGFAQHRLSEGTHGYSTLLSSLGVGALCAALTTATFGTEARRRLLILGGMSLVSVSIMGLSFFRTLIPASICCAGFGYGMILFFSTGQAMVQLSTLNHHRGKVMGVWAMMLSGGVPVGNLLLGPAADQWGVERVLFAQSLAVGLVVLLLWCRTGGEK